MLDQRHNYDNNYACTSAAWMRYIAPWRVGKQERWAGHGVQLPLGVGLVLSCLHLQGGEVQRRKHYSWRSCSFHLTGLHHSRTRETSKTVVILTTDHCPDVSSRHLVDNKPHWHRPLTKITLVSAGVCHCLLIKSNLYWQSIKIQPVLAKYENPTYIGKVCVRIQLQQTRMHLTYLTLHEVT